MKKLLKFIENDFYKNIEKNFGLYFFFIMSKFPQIPIQKDADEHYRYKMPRLTSRKVSSGNGVKTAILNAKDVAKAIGRSLTCLNQWFGYALAVQSKQGKNQNVDQLILNGNHSEHNELIDSLYEFIDNFVICPACKNPETTFEVQNKKLFLHCHSCGNVSPVQPTSHAPVQKMIEWLVLHVDSEKNKQPMTATTQVKGRIDAIDDFQKSEQGKEDTGAGVYINVEELTALSNQLEPKAEEPQTPAPPPEEIDAFFNKFQGLAHSDISNNDLYKEFSSFFSKYPMINTSTQMSMVIEALFLDHDQQMLDIIKTRNTFLIRLTLDESAQKDFLYLMGRYICQINKKLMSSAPIIFYTLFENEIFEEPAYQIWLKKPSQRIEKQFKNEASELKNNILKDFTNWIQTAKYDENEEPSSDEENVEENAEENAEAQHKEEEDIDIDNI